MELNQMPKEQCPVIKDFCDDLEYHQVSSRAYAGIYLLWCKECQRDPVYMDVCPKTLLEPQGRGMIRTIQKLGARCKRWVLKSVGCHDSE